MRRGQFFFKNLFLILIKCLFKTFNYWYKNMHRIYVSTCLQLAIYIWPFQCLFCMSLYLYSQTPRRSLIFHHWCFTDARLNGVNKKRCLIIVAAFHLDLLQIIYRYRVEIARQKGPRRRNRSSPSPREKTRPGPDAILQRSVQLIKQLIS